MAAALQTCFYGDEIWESSHTKGHRFAASMLLMPWGYSYGRLNSAAAIDMLKHATRGEMFLPGNRGRGCFDAPGQVAELVVADRVISAEGSLDVGALRVDAELNEPGDVDGMAGTTETTPCEGRCGVMRGCSQTGQHVGGCGRAAGGGASSGLAAHDFFGEEIA